MTAGSQLGGAPLGIDDEIILIAIVDERLVAFRQLEAMAAMSEPHRSANDTGDILYAIGRYAFTVELSERSEESRTVYDIAMSHMMDLLLRYDTPTVERLQPSLETVVRSVFEHRRRSS